MSGEVFAPRSYGQHQAPMTRAGVAVATPDGGHFIDIGILEGANWWWNPETKILSVSLVAGASGGVAPATKITSGLLREDGKEIAGDLAEILRVIQSAPKAGPARSLTKDEAAANAKAAPTGVAAIIGNVLVLTPEGLANLEGVLTSGGRPRSELDRDAQQGKVPAAIDVRARFASWRASPAKGSHDLSMPILFGAGMDNPIQPLLPADATSSLPMTSDPSVEGDRFEDGVTRPKFPIPAGPNTTRGSIRLFGRMIAFDMSTGTDLDQRAARDLDPESYQERARWVPAVELDPEEVWGDDEPPPRKPPPGGDPEPPPPEKPPEKDPHEGEGPDAEEGPDPKNPQERNLTAPATLGIVGSGGAIVLPDPEVNTIGSNTEAFTTETGNATDPHAGGVSIADEDEEDALTAGGVSTAPLTAKCPLEGFTPNPDLEEWLDGMGEEGETGDFTPNPDLEGEVADPSNDDPSGSISPPFPVFGPGGAG